MEKKIVTEESGIQKSWYEESEKVHTIKEAAAFATRLGKDYQHDYGTICHALSASILAMGRAFDREFGGITGFQAGCVMWGFITHWDGLDGPARITRYRDLLYPQHKDKFKTISGDTWKWVQEEARKKIDDHKDASPKVKSHWQTVVDGIVPFGLSVE